MSQHPAVGDAMIGGVRALGAVAAAPMRSSEFKGQADRRAAWPSYTIQIRSDGALLALASPGEHVRG
jgi:hypothetical protein